MYLHYWSCNYFGNGKHNRNSILVSNSFFRFKLKAATEKQQRLKMGLLWPKINPFCFWCMHIQWPQLWKLAPTYNTFDSSLNIWNGYGIRIIHIYILHSYLPIYLYTNGKNACEIVSEIIDFVERISIFHYTPNLKVYLRRNRLVWCELDKTI